MMRNAVDRFVSWFYIRRLWGRRCSDYEPSCCVCARWHEHDEIFNGGPELKEPPIFTGG